MLCSALTSLRLGTPKREMALFRRLAGWAGRRTVMLAEPALSVTAYAEELNCTFGFGAASALPAGSTTAMVAASERILVSVLII